MIDHPLQTRSVSRMHQLLGDSDQNLARSECSKQNIAKQIGLGTGSGQPNGFPGRVVGVRVAGHWARGPGGTRYPTRRYV